MNIFQYDILSLSCKYFFMLLTHFFTFSFVKVIKTRQINCFWEYKVVVIFNAGY